MSYMYDLVQQKIEYDRNICKNVPADSIIGESDRKNIRAFFPDLFSDGDIDTTTLPQGCRLSQYLIVGGVPVINLRATDTRNTFVKEHGIRVSDAEYLAERRLLIPNLYERNPESWRGSDPAMAGLISKSYVVGERVDSLLSAKYEYDDYVTYLEDFLQRKYGGDEIIDANQADMKERAIGADDFKIIARRYGYLRIYEPESANEAEELFVEGKFKEASKRIRIQKWSTCTDITGAVGGRFIYGPRNLEQIYSIGKISSSNAEFISRFLGDRVESLEYLFQSIAGGNEVGFSGEIRSDLLSKFLSQPDVAELKRSIAQLSDDLFEDALKGGIDDPKVDDYRKRQKEYSDRLSKAASLGRKGDAAVAPVVQAAGILSGHALEGLLGFAGIFHKAYGLIHERPGERLGKWAASRRSDAVRARVVGLTNVKHP